jgi:hypothetical protein
MSELLSTQHHYVVCFDTETGKWNIEDETRYFDGTIYDTATDEWSHAINNDVNYAKDEELYDTLNAVLSELNEDSKEV